VIYLPSPAHSDATPLGTTHGLGPLTAAGISRTFGARPVLTDIDLTASPGERVGIVGENGSGKSTLLRILAGVDTPDRGTLTRPDDLGYLAQDPPFDPADRIDDVLRDALADLHELVQRVEHLGEQLAGHADDARLAERYAVALDRAVAHDAWDARRRATDAAARLGLADLDGARRIGSLSGGERTRLALAALMTRRPSCVLLDEPTNHLDDDALDMLEDFLVGLPGVVVAASHDRVFLDRVATTIVDLDPSHFGTDGHGGRRYRGGFSDYLQAKAEARRRWEETYRDQQDELAALRHTVSTSARQVSNHHGPRDNDKFLAGFKAGTVARAVSRRVRDAQRRLDQAEAEQVRKPRAPLSFDDVLTGPARGNGVVVSVRDLHVHRRVYLPRLDVRAGEHVLVTGANGSGKSSLLAVFAGWLRPDGGTVSVAATRIGVLQQDVAYPHPDRDARSTFVDAMRDIAGPDADPGTIAKTLTDLGLLHGRELMTPVGSLSVGQQRRLALAIVVAHQPDLLLLDEPTNHVSLALAGELEESLARSPGTVLIASHDRWLRSRWQGQVVPIEASAPGRT